MSSTDQREPSRAVPGKGISSAGANEFSYRPISGMAVFCLLASILGLAAFLNLFFVPFAVVILILSIVTSIRLDRAKEEYGGQLLAKLAVLLGLVGTVGAATSQTVQYYALANEAKQYGEDYLRYLLADDLEEGFRMRLAPQIRTMCKDDVKEMLFQYNKNYEAYKKEKVTQVLRAGGKDAKIEFVSTTPLYQLEGLTMIGVDYRVTLPGNPEHVFDVTLGIHGGTSYVGDWEGRQWYIRGNEAIVQVSGSGPDAPPTEAAPPATTPEPDAGAATPNPPATESSTPPATVAP